MPARSRRGWRAPDAAAGTILRIDAADLSLPACPLQAVARLADHVGRQRSIYIERGAALRAAYAALRRADELAPACELRRAATVALEYLAETRGDLAQLHEFERFAGLQS